MTPKYLARSDAGRAVGVVLKLDTKASLFEPIEVEIDGQRFEVKRITLGDLEKIQSLQEKAAAGSATAIRESIEALLVGSSTKILKSLPLDKLSELIEVVVQKSVKPGIEEKNAPGPGDGSTPS